jgi:hypothetical protein
MKQVDGAKEVLFYLLPPFEPLRSDWELVKPGQTSTATSVKPTNPLDQAGQEALIELHSHHHLPAKFSKVDDKDEIGFRLYAVIGNLATKPAIRLRVGIYGYFMEIPASEVFCLPDGLENAG